MGPIIVSIFIALNYCSMLFDRHEEFPNILVQILCENRMSSSLSSDVCGQIAIVKFGRLGKVSLVKNGFQRSCRSSSKWTKHGQTALLVAGHDLPSILLSIWIYLLILAHNCGIRLKL